MIVPGESFCGLTKCSSTQLRFLRRASPLSGGPIVIPTPFTLWQVPQWLAWYTRDPRSRNRERCPAPSRCRVQLQQECRQRIQLRVAQLDGRHGRPGPHGRGTFEVLNHPGGVFVDGAGRQVRPHLAAVVADRVASDAVLLAEIGHAGHLFGRKLHPVGRRRKSICTPAAGGGVPFTAATVSPDQPTAASTTKPMPPCAA